MDLPIPQLDAAQSDKMQKALAVTDEQVRLAILLAEKHFTPNRGDAVLGSIIQALAINFAATEASAEAKNSMSMSFFDTTRK